MSDTDQTPPKTLITPPEGVATIHPDAEAVLETAGADPLHEAAPEPEAAPAPATPPAGLPLLPNGKAPGTTRDVVLAYAGANGGEVPVGQTLIQDLSVSLKSLDNVALQAQRSTGQSPSMQIGARAALSSAVQSHSNRFGAAVKHFGHELASEIRSHLIGVSGLKLVDKHEEIAASLTPPPTPG